MNLSSSDEEPWKTIDMFYLSQLHQMHRTDGTIAACSQLLRNRLLGLGIMFLSEDDTKVPTREFFDFVSRKWAKFTQDAMVQLIIQGFAAYVINPATKGSFAFPTCVPFGRGQYVLRYDKYHNPQMGFVSNSKKDSIGLQQDEIKPDTKTMFMVLNYPDMDGRVVSAVSNAYSIQAFKRQLEANTVFADRICARPPVLTTNRTNDTFDNRDLMGLTGTETGAAYERTNLMFRNQMNVEVWNQQSNLVSTLNSNNIDTASSAWQARIDPITGLPVMSVDQQNQYVPQFIPLPMDSVVASLQLPQRPHDFVPMMQQITTTTCLCMGLSPHSLLGASSNASSSFASLADEMMNFSIMRYRMSITSCLKDIYAVIFNLDYKKKKAPDIQVIFPSLHNPETIMRLYTAGFMPYDVFIVELTRFFGFSKESFLTEQEHEKYIQRQAELNTAPRKEPEKQHKNMMF